MAPEAEWDCKPAVKDPWVSKPVGDRIWNKTRNRSTTRRNPHRKIDGWGHHRSPESSGPTSEDLGDAIYGLFPDEDSDAVEEIKEIRRDV